MKAFVFYLLIPLIALVAVLLAPAVKQVAIDCAEVVHQVATRYMQRAGLMLMAEFDSRQLTSLEGTPKVKVPPYDHGRITVQVATTPAAAAWAQNDTWNTGIIIPKGSRILRSGRLSHSAWGASVTMSIGVRAASDGTVVDVDGIAATLDVAAAGVKELDGGSLFAAGLANVTTQDLEVYCSALAANPTDNAQAEVEIHWIGPVSG